MIETASYRSFLVRLWREPGVEGDAWRGEVEYIQSGMVVAVASLEEALDVICQLAHGSENCSADPDRAAQESRRDIDGV